MNKLGNTLKFVSGIILFVIGVVISYEVMAYNLVDVLLMVGFLIAIVGIILIRVIPFLNYYGVIVSAYSAKIEEMAELSSSSGEKSYTPSSNRGISDSQYRELEKAAKEFEDACDLYNRELNKIADKATSPAYSGVMAQSLFWDCNDAFNLVRKKGARFARVLRDCGQSDRARELEQRLKSDERKYQSYKDEVNRMLGVY